MISKPIRRVIIALCRSRYELSLVCREHQRYRVELAAFGKIKHIPMRAASKSIRLALAIAIIQIDSTSRDALAGAVAVLVTYAVIYAADFYMSMVN